MPFALDFDVCGALGEEAGGWEEENLELRLVIQELRLMPLAPSLPDCFSELLRLRILGRRVGVL